MTALTSKVHGFPKAEARRAVDRLLREAPGAPVEELIRKALTLLAKS